MSEILSKPDRDRLDYAMLGGAGLFGGAFDERVGGLRPVTVDLQARAAWTKERPFTLGDVVGAGFALLAQKLGFDVSVRENSGPLGERLGTGGIWDLKKMDRAYEPWGNYQFGYLAKKAGLSEGEAVFYAGAYQYAQNLGNKKSESETTPSLSDVLFSPNHGDEPEDSERIRRGWRDSTLYDLGMDWDGGPRLQCPISDFSPSAHSRQWEGASQY